MRWRRTDPVQTVDALIVTGAGSVARLADAMARKSDIFGSVRVEQGEEWIALFGAPADDGGAEGDAILPRLEGAIPLHEAARGWWLPVGWALAAPDHVRDLLFGAMADHHDIDPPAIVVPRADLAERTGAADIYLIRDPIPLARWSFGTPGRAA